MFVHAWAIALGVAAASLPFLVHWLTKPRPVRLPISTLRFVREAVQQRRARHRLRDFIVLALRTAAILLLAAAIARPLIGQARSALDDPDADRIRVVILDVSQSMGAGVRGIENFERARPQAGKFLEYRSGLKANLILAGARPQATFEAPSTNFGALQDALASATVRPERLNVQQALNLAADVFSSSPETDAKRELVVISDFQRTNWAAADFSVLPDDTAIQLEAVVPEGAPANLAILGVRALGRVQAGQEAQLAVEIGNYSPAPRTVRVEVDLGDAVYPLEGDCAPRSRTTLQAQFRVPTDGWRTGIARLIDVDDALAADNQRFWAVQSRPRPTIVILTREREDQRPSNSYYMERALVPDSDSIGGPEVVRADAVDPDPETITRADVIVIVRSGRLSNDTIHQIAQLLRRGRGVLYVATDGVDSVNLQQFAEAAGPGLQLPVEFSPPPSGTPRTALFLTNIEQELPPFAVFGDRLPTAIAPLRFGGGLASRRVAETLAEDVRATFNDQSAFLVVTSSEAGKLAVLNADLTASDLPGSPLFVPLIAELMQQELLGTEGGANEFASGEPFTLSLPAGTEGVASMQITGPDDANGEFGQLTQEAAGIVWQGPAAGPPGAYEVRQDDATIAAIVTAVPDEESDLRTLTADVLEERLAGGRQVTYRAGASISPDADDTAWSWLLAACVLCVIGESAVLRAFRT